MKENEKKIIKIVVIAIIAIVCIYVIFVIRRYCILNEVSKMRKENYHMLIEDTSSSSATTYEYWKKDSVSKIKLKGTGNNTVHTFWNDTIKKENYTFSDLTDRKMYKVTEVPELTLAIPVELDTTAEKLKYALNPFRKLKIEKDNKIKYYILERRYNTQENNDGNVQITKLSFDTVTDENVALPNINDYELISSTI